MRMTNKYWFRGRWYNWRATSFWGVFLIFAYLLVGFLAGPWIKAEFGGWGLVAWSVICTAVFLAAVHVKLEPRER
jgi:hypothetical protein